MGLIIPRNPLLPPGSQAALNPNHPMFKGARLAAVAGNGGAFIDLLTAKASSPTSPLVTGVHGFVGQSVRCTGSTVCNTFTNPYADSPSSITMAAIIGVNTTSNSTNSIFSTRSTSGTGAAGLQTGTGRSIQAYANGSTASSGFNTAAGHQFFLGVSLSASKQNWCAVALDNHGAVQTTTTTAMTMTVGTFTWSIGGVTAANVAADCDIAAVAYSINNFMSPAELLEWGQNPWDYWYPPTLRTMIFASLGTSAAANTGTLAITEPTETFAFVGTDFNAGTLAVTEPTETFAFAGTDFNAGTLAVTEPTETFAFAGADTTSGVLAVTEPTETFAFAGSDVNSGTLAVTEPTETFAFTGSDAISGSLAFTEPTETFDFNVTVVPPPPQPGPQKLFPLRERTYRRRFLGVGYDPICVITKDRPGPMRIIEFIGEIKDE